MALINKVKGLLDRRGFRSGLAAAATHLARARGSGVERIFYDRGVWIHHTNRGYFAYHQPFVRLDMAHMEKLAKVNFLWGYTPQVGDVVIDVGAGVGEEALTFSQLVGKPGRVICIEAHPRTYRCLETLVQYNHLENVIAIHCAVAEPSCAVATIEDSEEYLSNRTGGADGFSIPATTIDSIWQQLGSGRIAFLKMNIEGGERGAVRGMRETLKHTEVLCVSCHDFLADGNGDAGLRTKSTVQRFLKECGFEIVGREGRGLPAYLSDQVWAYSGSATGKRNMAS